MRRDVKELRNASGEAECAEEHACADAEGEVVRADHDGDGGERDERSGLWIHADVAQRSPAERADGNHEHDGDQRGHRDLRDPAAEQHDEDQKEKAGPEGGETSATAGFYVDHGLADHGASTHAAEEAGDKVGDALAAALDVFIGGRVGVVVHDGRGHQGLKEADDGHRYRVGQDDEEGCPREREIGKSEGGERRRELAHVANGAEQADIGSAEPHGQSGEDDDADKGRRDCFGDEREAVDDGETAGDAGIHERALAVEFADLREQVEDGEGVDEADHHRAGHEAHEVTELEPAGDELDNAGEQRRGEQVLQAVIVHEVDDKQGDRTGRGGDHAAPAADKGDGHGDAERSVEADLWVDAGDDGKGDGLRDEGEGDDGAGEEIADGVAEPGLFILGKGRCDGCGHDGRIDG